MKVTLNNAQQGHAVLKDVWTRAKPYLLAGNKLVLTIEQEKRSLLQNSKLWAMLSEVSQQVKWHGEKLSPEDWKHIFSAALKKQRIVPGIDSGFVVLSQSTSKMNVSEMADLIELIFAFGASHEVKFSCDMENNS